MGLGARPGPGDPARDPNRRPGPRPAAERGRLTVRVAWTAYRWVKDDKTLLEIPQLDLAGPGLVLLLGSTGSGKTTLLRSLTGDLEDLEGGRIDGRVDVHRPTASPGPVLGYLPQDASNAFLSFDARTEFAIREQGLGIPRERAHGDADERAARLRLAPRLSHASLSGGERKRLALAAIQIGRPPILLLDEPFNHLDLAWRGSLLRDVLAAAESSLVIVATHQPDELLPHALRVVVLRRAQLAFDGPRDEFGRRRTEFPETLPAPPPAPTPPSASAEPLVLVDGVSLEAGNRRLVNGASASWSAGVHALIGPNGSGKTTLLRALIGLHPVSAGRIRIAGQDPTRTETSRLSRAVAYHPEEPIQMFFRPSVDEELAVAPTHHGIAACDVTARVREAAFDFGLDALLDRNPWSLSGGERERLALACLDAARAPVILLDEPTQGLDAAGRQFVTAFLERRRRQACVLLATHDEALVRLADTVHEIRERRLRPTRGTLLEVSA